MNLPTIRCSSLPRVMSCTASMPDRDDAGILIDTSGDVSDIGTAAHAVYATMVRESLDEIPDSLIFDVAAKHGVEEGELRMLAWRGLAEWKKIRNRLELIAVEREYESAVNDAMILTGHPDVMATLADDPDTLVVVDWKAGYLEKNYVPQLKGYALLGLLSNLANVTRIIVLTVFTRKGVTETLEFSAEEIMAFSLELSGIVRAETRKYCPSDENCMYCPVAKIGCPARQALLETTCREIQALTGNVGGELTPARLAELYPQTRMLKKALDQYDEMIKSAVAMSGGVIRFGDGEELALEESETTAYQFRPEILIDYIPQEAIDEIRPTMSKDKAKAAIGDHAPKGKKGAMIAACFEALEQAGAATKTARKTLKHRKAS